MEKIKPLFGQGRSGCSGEKLRRKKSGKNPQPFWKDAETQAQLKKKGGFMASCNRIVPVSSTMIGASLLGGALIPLMTVVRHQAQLPSRFVQLSRISGVGFIPLGLALFAYSQFVAYRNSPSFQQDLMPFGA